VQSRKCEISGSHGCEYELFTALMMEAVRVSETSVNFNVTTQRYIPEDSKLHTRRRENLRSHTVRYFT